MALTAIVGLTASAAEIEFSGGTSEALASAIADAPDGSVLKVRSELVAFSSMIEIGKSITLEYYRDFTLGDFTGNERMGFFTVLDGGRLSLKGIRFVSGYGNTSSPIDVRSGGELSATDCEFIGNRSSTGDGGAISACGVTTLTRCYFENNRAMRVSGSGDARGGAVFAKDALVVIDSCSFTNNWLSLSSGGRGYGGAVYYANTSVDARRMIVVNSTLAGNRCNAVACAGNGVMALVHTTLVGNLRDAGNDSPAIETYGDARICAVGCASVGNQGGDFGTDVERDWTVTSAADMISSAAETRTGSAGAKFLVCAAKNSVAKSTDVICRDFNWRRIGYRNSNGAVTLVFSLDGTTGVSGMSNPVITDIRGFSRTAYAINSVGSAQTKRIDIRFLKNDGSDVVYATRVVEDSPYGTIELLDPSGAQRTGYTCVGWSADSRAREGVTGICPVSEFLPREDAISADVYAVWRGVDYTVRFHRNCAPEETAEQTLEYGNPTPLTLNDFSRSGYHFLGWNTKPDGSGVGFRDGERVSDLALGGSVDLYARWGAATGCTVYNEAEFDMALNRTFIPKITVFAQKSFSVPLLYERSIGSDDFEIVNLNPETAVYIDATGLSGNRHRHFSVGSAGSLRLKGVTLMGGLGGSGGSIVNYGRLDVRYCNFVGNVASNASGVVYGGAIANAGYCLVRDSRFANCRAVNTAENGRAVGAGIYNTGTAVVDRVTMLGGSLSSPSAGAVSGGAIFSDGERSSLVVANSTICDNTNAVQVVQGVAAFVQTTITDNRGDYAALWINDSRRTVLIGTVVAGNSVNGARSGADQLHCSEGSSVFAYASLFGACDQTSFTADDSFGYNVSEPDWSACDFLEKSASRREIGYGIWQTYYAPTIKYTISSPIRLQGGSGDSGNPFQAIGFADDDDMDARMVLFPEYVSGDGATDSLTEVNWLDQLGENRRYAGSDSDYWVPGAVGVGPVIGQTSLADATGFSAYPLKTGGYGTVKWLGQTNTVHSSTSAAMSGWVEEGESAYLSTEVVGPGTLTFYWKNSGDEDDTLTFSCDGEWLAEADCPSDWEQRTVTIDGAGSHTLSWEYMKWSGRDESGHAWVAEVVWTPSAPNPLGPFSISSFALDQSARRVRIVFPTVSGHSYRIRVSKDFGDWTVVPSSASESEEPIDARHYGTGEPLTLYAETTDPSGFYQVLAD